jgi:hypothetical protein
MDPTDDAHAESIADRLQRATDELKILEQLILCAEFSPRLLGEFRSALDSIRATARIVQLWSELQQPRQAPYSAISTVAEDRVRRATKIAKDLTVDLRSKEMPYATEELAELYGTISSLREQLATISRTKGPRKSNSAHSRANAVGT